MLGDDDPDLNLSQGNGDMIMDEGGAIMEEDDDLMGDDDNNLQDEDDNEDMKIEKMAESYARRP